MIVEALSVPIIETERPECAKSVTDLRKTKRISLPFPYEWTEYHKMSCGDPLEVSAEDLTSKPNLYVALKPKQISQKFAYNLDSAISWAVKTPKKPQQGYKSNAVLT